MPSAAPYSSTASAVPRAHSAEFGETPKASIETHVLGFSGDLYGRQAEVSFVQRLRDERRFPDVDALREQIAADVRRAERLFDRLSV